MLNLLLFLTLTAFSNADHFEIATDQLEYGLPKVLRAVAMYAPDDVEHEPPGNGNSFIRIHVEFRSTINVTGHVEAWVLQRPHLDGIGYTLDGDENPTYCCTEKLAIEKGLPGCSLDNVGSLIITNPDEGKQWSVSAIFKLNTWAKMDGATATYNVETTGEHFLLMVNCDEAIPMVEYSGTTTWMNPYGMLPGRMYGFLNFYLIMSIIFLVFAMFWGLLNVCNWESLFELQHLISCTILLCMVEFLVWYFDYRNFNNTGYRHVGTTVWGILLSCVRETFSRCLVVAVSLGYGVVRPSLGRDKCRLILLGIVYFIFEASKELVVRYEQTNKLGNGWRAFLAIPVAILNAIFYWWVFSSLYKTCNHLEARQQMIKFYLYKRFTYVLMVSLVLTVVFAVYQMYYISSGKIWEEWEQLYILDGAFATVIYSVILVSIAILFRPSKSSNRYAYSQVLSGDDEDAFGCSQYTTLLICKAIYLSMYIYTHHAHPGQLEDFALGPVTTMFQVGGDSDDDYDYDTDSDNDIDDRIIVGGHSDDFKLIAEKRD